MLLGHQLRKHRERSGLTREAAGEKIRASASKISRMELGRVGFKTRDIEDLLKLYGVTDRKLLKQFRELAAESNKPGWWKEYGDALHKWFIRYVGFEEAADQIRIYESQFVPGLLQTEEYAREIISGGVDTDMVTEQRIQARLTRQKHLEAGKKMWIILDEAAVRRPIGGRERGPEIMAGQLRHLIHLCENHENVTLQIIPFEVGAHAAEAGSFTLLRYSEFELSDIVYLEQLTDGEVIDKPATVESYTKAMTRLSVSAATPDETLSLLKDMLKDLEGN
ncbi:helix-turn-helix transcriptional regulator [Streptomyces sp. NPDC000931]|uniref:helix-turn-helix domain-containing protein n=1 Tax=Streptomyces sp. NPDC000931 TaxID=3154372 RepID=UPI003317DCE6